MADFFKSRGIHLSILAFAIFLAFSAPVLIAKENSARPQLSGKSVPISALAEGDFAIVPRVGESLKILGDSALANDGLSTAKGIISINSWREEINSPNLIFVSRYLILKSKQLMNVGNFKGALQTARDAVFFSPDDHNAWLQQASLEFRNNGMDVKSYLPSLASALYVYFRSPANLEAFLGKFMAYLIPSIVIAYAVFAFTVFAANLGPIKEEIRRMAPFEMGASQSLIAVILLALLIAVGGSIFLLALSLPFFIRGYLSRNGRLVMAVFLFLLALLPISITFGSRTWAVSVSPLAKAVESYSSGNWDTSTVLAFQDASLKEPSNMGLVLALGELWVRAGEVGKAESIFGKILEKNPDNPKALTGLGAAHFLKGEYEFAEAKFLKALESLPESGLINYNLSITYAKLHRAKEYSKRFVAAMKLDRELMDSILKNGKEALSSKPAAFRPDLSNLQLMGTEIISETEKVSSALWSMFWGNLKMEHYLQGSIGYLAVLAFFFLFGEKIGGLSACLSCGTTFSLSSAKGGNVEMHCGQCLSLYSSGKDLRGTVSLSRKGKKLAEIKSFQSSKAKITNVTNLLLPGVGAVYDGKYAIGAFFLTLSFFLLSVLSALVLFPPAYVGPSAIALWTALLLLYYIAAIKILWREG